MAVTFPCVSAPRVSYGATAIRRLAAMIRIHFRCVLDEQRSRVGIHPTQGHHHEPTHSTIYSHDRAQRHPAGARWAGLAGDRARTQGQTRAPAKARRGGRCSAGGGQRAGRPCSRAVGSSGSGSRMTRAARRSPGRRVRAGSAWNGVPRCASSYIEERNALTLPCARISTMDF